MSKSIALSQIRESLKAVTFEDMDRTAAALLCQIIVNGKPTNYHFKGWQDGPGYYAHIDDGTRHDDYRSVDLDELTEALLVRAGLIQKREISTEPLRKIEPTPKGLTLYERLKAEGKLDRNGYLARSRHKT